MYQCEKQGQVQLFEEVNYEDYKCDKGGRKFIADRGEHKVVQVLCMRHQHVKWKMIISA